MEFFDVYYEDGFPTGNTVSRAEAHEKGILHAAVHIYVYRVVSGKLQILLQKRADDKDSFPGCWDTSCAGHVSAGETFDETLVKELSEELGIHIAADEANHLFTKIVTKNNVFHGKPFNDHEVYRVYALNYDAPAESIIFQKEEISAVRWMDADDLLSELERGNKDYCIMPNTYREALEFLRKEI